LTGPVPPAPFRLDPTTLYTRNDLIEALRPLGIDPDAWVGRIRPVKRFRQAWWGADLIKAIEAAPALGAREVTEGAADLMATMPAAGNRGNRKARKVGRLESGPLERMASGQS
jgi:hypothetical protein